jgi:hypothetical protein
MKRHLASINLLHIITLIMIGLILAAMLAGHFSYLAKGHGATHSYGAPVNSQVSR